MAQTQAMAHIREGAVTVGPQGRLVIPAPLRRELGITPGSVLAARVEDGHLILEPRDAVLARIRSRFKPADGVSLARELIRERREEARRESRS